MAGPFVFRGKKQGRQSPDYRPFCFPTMRMNRPLFQFRFVVPFGACHPGCYWVICRERANFRVDCDFFLQAPVHGPGANGAKMTTAPCPRAVPGRTGPAQSTP